jgi:DNA-binding winged helix-turn-helix (wHTH) protein
MQPEPARSPSRSDFRVGDRLVRPALNRIDGPAGPVQVEPRVMEVLVHLAGRAGEVVSKEELVRDVWEGRFVSDDVVWRSIRELRRALGDATWIQTIPKRGYRLQAPEAAEEAPVPKGPEIEEAPVGDLPPPSAGSRLVPRRFLVGALLLGFALIAVLVVSAATKQPEPAPVRSPAGVRLTAASPEAHDAVLRGRHFLSRGLPDDLRRSADAFREATVLDPGSAAAWAGLADALHLLVLFGAVPPREGIPPAEEAAQKALALDDMLAQTHATLGTIRFRHHWDWDGGETEMRRALEIDPDSAAAHHDLAWLLLAEGRFDEAVAEIRAALELEPLSVRANADVGWVYYRARRDEEAIRQMERTLEMEPRFLPARHCLERALAHAGRLEEALLHAREAARQEGMDAADVASLPADPRAALQRIANWRLEHLQGRGGTDPVSPYAQAALQADLGDREEALAALGRALEERDPMLVSVNVDPAFDAVRTDPRFQAIVARVGGRGPRRPS